MIYLEFLLLLFSFYALARLVDLFFVETLEIISKKLKLSSDVAGATFMAVGSSAPELFVSILALTKVGEQQAIGAGTIVGSAIFNILVLVGASALFKRATLTWQPLIRDLGFYIIAILLLLITFMDGKITLLDSLLYLSLYVFYIFSLGFWKKIFPYTSKDDLAEDASNKGRDSGNPASSAHNLDKNSHNLTQPLIEEAENKQSQIRKSSWKLSNVVDKLMSLFFINLEKHPKLYLINFLISIVLLALFSKVMIDSAVSIAVFFNVPSVIIGLTILAAGTSIPDLLSSINVAKKGKGDMAIANAVGSNIFDIAIGLGAPWFLLILFAKKEIVVLTENLSSSIFLLLSTVVALLFILIVKKWEIGRYAGIILILAYVAYILSQLGVFSFLN